MITAAAAPVKVVTVAAFTAPVVFPSRVFKTVAARVVSLMVTVSLSKPAIPPEA